MARRKIALSAGTLSFLVAALLILMLVQGCNSNAQKLAKASQLVAHTLQLFQSGEQLAVQNGNISAAEDVAIQGYIKQVAQAGLALDTAIKANESNPAVGTQLNNFLAAFQTLISQGVGGIKNAQTKQDLMVVLQGAEAAIAVISSVVGGS